MGVILFTIVTKTGWQAVFGVYYTSEVEMEHRITSNREENSVTQNIYIILILTCATDHYQTQSQLMLKYIRVKKINKQET